MAKNITTLDWTARATSDDRTRPSLTRVYRASTNFVATDGHRLHISSQLPATTAGYLDGSADHQFPEYSQVIPTSDPSACIEFYLDSELLKTLGTVAKLAGKLDYFTIRTVATGKLEISLDKCSVGVSSIFAVLKVNYDETGSNGEIPGIRVNPKYFLEAMPDIDNRIGEKVSLYYRGEVQVLKIQHRLGEAYVMPMRK